MYQVLKDNKIYGYGDGFTTKEEAERFKKAIIRNHGYKASSITVKKVPVIKRKSDSILGKRFK